MAALCLGLLFAGCQQAQETPAEQAAETTEAVEEEVALTDPVCGMEVTAESSFSFEYEGETYYFCSQGCLDRFIEEPMAYIGAEVEEATEEVMEEVEGT
jgi:YHS domain-containing protein